MHVCELTVNKKFAIVRTRRKSWACEPGTVKKKEQIFVRRDRLEAALKAHGVSIEDIAPDIGVDQSTLYRWRDAASAPPIAGALALSLRLGLSLGFMMGIEDDADYKAMIASELSRLYGEAVADSLRALGKLDIDKRNVIAGRVLELSVQAMAPHESAAMERAGKARISGRTRREKTTRRDAGQLPPSSAERQRRTSRSTPKLPDPAPEQHGAAGTKK